MKDCVLVLLVWQVTTWEERPTGPEASTSTPLYPSDQAGGALVTSSEHTSSSMPETYVTSTTVSSCNPTVIRWFPRLTSIQD